MVNIKRYNDTNLLEDLEDYLQEFFDKYNIIQWSRFVEMDPLPNSPFYDIIKPRGSWDRYKLSLHILNVNSKILNGMANYLFKIRPTIEKRLGNKIDIRIIPGEIFIDII